MGSLVVGIIVNHRGEKTTDKLLRVWRLGGQGPFVESEDELALGSALVEYSAGAPEVDEVLLVLDESAAWSQAGPWEVVRRRLRGGERQDFLAGQRFEQPPDERESLGMTVGSHGGGLLQHGLLLW